MRRPPLHHVLSAAVAICVLAFAALALAEPAVPGAAPATESKPQLRYAVVNFGSLAAVVFLAVFTIRRREAWELKEWETRGAARDASESAARETTAARQGAPEVLRCPACATPIALGSSDRAACPSCRAEVVIPPAYAELARTRAAASLALTRDVAELRSVERFTHPAWALAWIAGAFGLGWVLVQLNNMAGDASDDSIIGLFAGQWLGLLIVPVGMVISAAGQFGAWSELLEVKTNFAASRDAKTEAWTCRCCAAPLLSADGVSAICSYCGSQNLLRSGAARAADANQELVHALAAQVTHARAVRWHWFWTGIQVPSFLLAAIGGLLFLSFGMVSIIAVLTS